MKRLLCRPYGVEVPPCWKFKKYVKHTNLSNSIQKYFNGKDRRMKVKIQKFIQCFLNEV